MPSPATIIVGLGGLYVAQSVIGGVVFTGLPAVLRKNGASLNDIAFILLTVLPWSFKFLWSPAVERYRSPRSGRRRSREVRAMAQPVHPKNGLVPLNQDVRLVPTFTACEKGTRP
ncbi:hypothetical protein ACIKTA_06400, partial [Hansschlegelia beijingensis]